MNHLRALWRLLLLTALILAALPARLLARSPLMRARWQQRNSRRVLRLLRARVRVEGMLPKDGLVVSNHLGYLDALVIGATLPTVFVAKSDVRGWPVVGFLCRLTGTIFVARDRSASVCASLAEMSGILESGVVVTLFPEGTSTGGIHVLPFKSSLLEVTRTHNATPMAVSYQPRQGKASELLCYWRDMTFAPHFWRVLGQPGFVAFIRFGSTRPPSADRKTTARELHTAVSNLHQHDCGGLTCFQEESKYGQGFQQPKVTGVEVSMRVTRKLETVTRHV